MAITTIRATAILIVVCVASVRPSPAQCLGDFNGDGKVTIDELVTAVDNALNGCQVIPPRFVDNGDGTVTDNQTGLMWEKKDTDCPGIHCYKDIFTWCSGPYPSCASGANPPDGTAFTGFLYALNSESLPMGDFRIAGCFNGYCDWRLPTIWELDTIMDPTQGSCGGGTGACIDPIFGATQTYYYWSATTLQHYPSEAWVVLTQGASLWRFKSDYANARAVRSGTRPEILAP
jgi:hypothetical protein